MSVDHVKIYVEHLSLRVWLLRDQSPHSRRAVFCVRVIKADAAAYLHREIVPRLLHISVGWYRAGLYF